MLKMHRTMADMMKAMGSRQARPMAGLANMLGPRRRHAEPGADAGAGDKMPGGLPGCRRAGWRGRPAADLPGLPPRFPGGPLLPGLGGTPPGLGGFPGLGKKK